MMCDGCGYYYLDEDDFDFDEEFDGFKKDAKNYCDRALYDFDKSNYCQNMIGFDFDIDYVVDEFEVIE